MMVYLACCYHTAGVSVAAEAFRDPDDAKARMVELGANPDHWQKGTDGKLRQTQGTLKFRVSPTELR